MDSRKDLKIIIEKNWQEILEYKNELSKKSVTDICNTQSYLSKSLAQNSISFLLFADASPFTKEINGSIWGIITHVI